MRTVRYTVYMIRAMKKSDAECVLDMMRIFYRTDAVLSDGSEEIFRNDIENCVNDNPYLEGYVFTSDDGSIIFGYAMAAKSFSTEFGKPCIWIEDIYVKPEYRGRGIGKHFLDFIDKKYADCILRLEVEPQNETAVHVYKKCGYEILPYSEMKKENK